MFVAGLEALDDLNAVLWRGVTGYRERSKLAQMTCQRLYSGHPLDVLRENQSLVSLPGELFQPVSDVVEFAGLPGLRVRVAYLLQAGDELEYVPDANLLTERFQIDDALLFGFVIAPALAGIQLNGNYGNLLRRQVIQDVVLSPTKLQLAVSRP